MIQLPEMPPNIAALRRDERGYPVPWFVAWIDGKPEFRCVRAEKIVTAYTQNRCWVCGHKIRGEKSVFVLGPMCTITRTTSEPPSHDACARFSARACPFLTHPLAQYRDANLPEDACNPAGEFIKRNPGCCALWTCDRYEIFPTDDRRFLFKVGEPLKVEFFAEGRPALRAEVERSFATGLPFLERAAMLDGMEAMVELQRLTEIAKRYWPQ